MDNVGTSPQITRFLITQNVNMENESRKGKEIVETIQEDDEDETFRNCKSRRKTCEIKYLNYKECMQKTKEIVENLQDLKKKRNAC